MQMLKQDKWKTLSSEYLFNRPWLTVRRDSYELPDGRIVPEPVGVQPNCTPQ